MIIHTKHFGEDIYTSNVDGIRYWEMNGATITKADDRCFSINEDIHSGLDLYPLDVFVTGKDGKFYGVFRVTKESKCRGPISFGNFYMFWYSTRDLDEISMDQIRERKDNIIKVLFLDNIIERGNIV